MKLFENVRTFFGRVKVTSYGNQIKVVGVDAEVMTRAISKIWLTEKVNKHMFTTVTNTSFSFNQFFVFDVVHILTTIKNDPTVRWVSKVTIDKIITGLETETWYKVTVQDHPSKIDKSKLSKMHWKPLPHQMEFLDVIGERLPKYDLKGMLLGAAPGTGKTFLDLMVATCIIPPSVAEVKIIISPKKAIHLVWEKTLKQVFKKVPTYWVSDFDTPMPVEKCEYYIFNFEALDKAMDLVKKLKTRNVRYFVIVDESHNFADPKSARTQKLVNLQTFRDDTYFIWASGSPILKSSIELVSFLKCADQRFDADAEQRFKRIYAASPGRANEIFNNRLGKMIGYVIGKSAVSTTKPTVKELPVRLPPTLAKKFLMSSVREEMKAFIVERLKFYEGQMKSLRQLVNHWLDYHERTLTTRQERKRFDEYRKAIKVMSHNPDRTIPELQDLTRKYERSSLIPSLPPTVRKEFRSALSAIKNIKLKVRGEALGTILSKRRSECATALGYFCKPEEIMKESLSKTLFFASSVLPIATLTKHLEEKGFHPLMVYGGTNSQLVSMMEQFDSDPRINPICATMQSLSEAVPVIAASTVVLLNRPYRQATYDQVIARADRLGQKHHVTIIEVTLDTGGEPNVSSTTDDILTSIREIINELVGDEFSGPDPDERQYKELVDASEVDETLFDMDA